MEEEFRAGGTGYGEFKRRLATAIDAYFAPFRARRAEFASRSGAVEEILEDGARRARAAAGETLARVRRAVGLSA